MNKRILLATVVAVFCCSFYENVLLSKAAWTVLAYMQGDNNLSSFMQKDIDEMIKGLSVATIGIDDRINMLVQLDQPNDNKTWRFRIEKTGKIEDESLSEEMGTNPEKEIVKSSCWIKEKYEADNYFWILWSHGSGVEDYKGIQTADGMFKFSTSFLQIPGMPSIYEVFLSGIDKKDESKNEQTTEKQAMRGILYDDSQNSCLTNQGMRNAFVQVRDILKPGSKLEILGMDACLMAMLEVVCQISDCFSYFVGSQQVEAGNGWDYSRFIGPLSKAQGDMSANNLAKLAVDAYGQCYVSGKDQTFTLAAYDLSAVEAVKAKIDEFVALTDTCLKYQSFSFKKAVIAARTRTVSFDNTNYIDLYSFLREMGKEVARLTSEAENYTPTCWFNKMSPKYIEALTLLTANIQDTMNIIYSNLVIRNTCGRSFVVGTDITANGVSIYYPSPKNTLLSIHRSYYDTLFAKNSKWVGFIQKYRNA